MAVAENSTRTELDLTGNSRTELSLFDEQTKATVRENYARELATVYQAVVGADYNEAKSMIDVGLESRFAEQARKKALNEHNIRRRQDIETDINSGADGERIRARVLEADQETEDILNTRAPEYAAGMASTEDVINSVWDAKERRVGRRVAAVQKMFEERMAQDDLSGWGIAWDVVDLVVSGGIPDLLTGGGFTRTNWAQEITALLQDDTISEEEFNEKVRDMVNYVADTGWLTENNMFFTMDFLQNIQEGGTGQTAGLDKIGTALEVIGMGSVLKGLTGTRALLNIRDGADVTKIFRGQKASEAAVANAFETGQGGVNVARRMGGDNWNKPGSKHQVSWVSPDHNALRIVENGNQYLDVLKSQDVGRFVSEEQLAKNMPRLLSEVNDSVAQTQTTRVNNINVVEDFAGNLYGQVLYGKKGGSAIKNKLEAQKRAKELGGEVVEAGVVDNKPAFLVSVTKNLPTKGMVDSTDPNELATHLMSAFGSTFLTTSARLDPIIKRGEAALGNITRQVARDYEKKWRAANNTKTPSGMRATQVVDKVWEKVRDGVLANRREPLSDGEFRAEYQQLAGHKAPEAAVEYHRALQQANDLDYLLTADPLYKDAVNRGEEVLRLTEPDDSVSTWRVVADSPEKSEGTKAYNVMTGETVDVAEDTVMDGGLFRVVGGYDVGGLKHERIIVPSDINWNTRRLYHTDVLGYNPGGHRVMPYAKWFAKQDNYAQTADGRRVKQSPITVGAYVTEKEAKLATDLMNDIIREVRTLIPERATKAQAIQAIKDNAGDDYLSEFIRSRNAFNPDIEDMEDFAEFLDEFDIDPRTDIGMAADGDQIRKLDEDGEYSLVAGFNPAQTYGESFMVYTNAAKGRRNKVLRGFGGQPQDTLTPIDRVENSFVRSVQRHSEQAYVHQAIQGWLQGAKRHLDEPVNSNLPLITQLRNAKVNTKAKEGRKFAQERKVILRRVAHRTVVQEKMEEVMTEAADWIYDKGWKSTSHWVRDKSSGDPSRALRALAFDLKLGLFAVDQLIIQSSHALAVATISNDWRASSAVPVLMKIARANGGNPKVLETMGENTKAFTGMSGKEFREFFEFMESTGRQHVDRTVIEQSQGDFALAKGMVNKTRIAGRMFFNAGEMVPRDAAMAVAWKEFRKQYPKVDPYSDFARNHIMRRQDVLTAGMTQASAAAWQKNMLSIPFQFLSYTSRMLEQLFTGAVNGRPILTRGERARLAVGQVLFWGAGGLGASSAVDWAEEEGLLPSLGDDVYTFLKYGMLDGFIDVFTDADTAFASRLGALEGVVQTYERIFDKDAPWYELAGGPSAKAATDIASISFKMMGEALSGSMPTAQYDFGRLIRNASSYNRGYQSWWIWKSGVYYSRKNQAIATGLGESTALFNMMGAPLQEVEMGYDAINIIDNHDEHIKTHGQRIQDHLNVMRSHLDKGNMEEAEEAKKEAQAMYAVLSPYERREIRWYIAPEIGGMFDQLIPKLLERDPGSETARRMLTIQQEGSEQ